MAEAEHARRPIPKPATVIQAALAQKVLAGWIQNRHQTLYPLVLAWKNMGAEEQTVLLSAVATALDAGEPDTRDRAAQWLRAVGAGDAPIEALTQGRIAPAPLGALVAAAREAACTPQAYAAAVGALGRRSGVNRRLQAFLAARLGVSDTVARSLNRRYGGG